MNGIELHFEFQLIIIEELLCKSKIKILKIYLLSILLIYEVEVLIKAWVLGKEIQTILQLNGLLKILSKCNLKQILGLLSSLLITFYRYMNILREFKNQGL